ncbi:MAG TPA: hypothetical protein VED18_13570 [Candidatus Sulfotelmatobacter sp.]|nr:hypothetical protein [Candidatus Sulfotelmatobacter sp.]
MAGASAGEGLARVQAEIEKEKAEALGRAGGRLEGAIRALRLIQTEIEALEAGRATPADPVRPAEAAARRRAEYAALRRQARVYHHYLIVQREALGFRKHGDVERLYPVPGPLAGSQGDRREAP